MITRRDLLATATVAPLSALARRASAQSAFADEFGFQGVYLDAAFVHPVSRRVLESSQAYFRDRFANPRAVSPYGNPRNGAVEEFARLIHCSPQDIAVVPSTLVAENLINAALRIGSGAGVVTDAFHYDASLVLYAEQRRQGTPVAIVQPRGERIELSDIRAALTSQTRLLALSLVASQTGHMHDLGAVCELAHSKNVLVYADIIQAAGAVPIDVAATGVDFAACGLYKWLMADFGAAFLYVRRDRLERLHRPEIGWRQMYDSSQHISPYDPPVADTIDYHLRDDAAGLFEVGSPAWESLATARTSIAAINQQGVEALVSHREPLIAHLREALGRQPGFVPLTPGESRGPILVFGIKDADKRFRERLRDRHIQISVYPNSVRISPSIYNTEADTQQLIEVLST